MRTGSGGDPPVVLGTPRLHLRVIDSTNTRARELAAAGAPHGTLVTAGEQRAGRGRQGRSWSAPSGRTLLCSLVIRRPPKLLSLSLAAGVAVAEVAGSGALVKWPNDVLVNGRKVAGILIEGRPQEDWWVVGIGLNVALEVGELPVALRETAGTLGLGVEAIEPTLSELMAVLTRWMAAPADAVLTAVRDRDALLDRPVSWEDGAGRGAGIDDDGRLLVATDDGVVALNAGEVHLRLAPA
jgi:BirA family transcriptional regulator, biotin operon repressor / biotin---[acetyl-CoA-carboxylase] ligase